MDWIIVVTFGVLIFFLLIAVFYLAYKIENLEELFEVHEWQIKQRMRKRDLSAEAFEDAVWAYFKQFKKRKKYKKKDKKFFGGRHDI